MEDEMALNLMEEKGTPLVVVMVGAAAALILSFFAGLFTLFTGGTQARRARHEISPEEKNRLIAEHAYRHAEERGFAPGDPMQDWLRAEKEVESELAHRDH
jgi:hypothetical protein